ncbi:Uu.00g093160.m01.CDS01 [Anthostomella pinea]|uniref:Uu.00g093160.m01.CDS01 n=1 Tax=Anthostomella pinea TaxID=933095 RepID=A0AAI8YKI8_9PEZI|nr:Uu.00g093160.m01.CDS01 [Anthostomella pinea]
MCEGDKAIWYAYSYGSDSHVFHMHGNNFRYNGDYMAAKNLNDGNMFTLYMPAGLRDVWQVLCHVAGHLST